MTVMTNVVMSYRCVQRVHASPGQGREELGMQIVVIYNLF